MYFGPFLDEIAKSKYDKRHIFGMSIKFSTIWRIKRVFWLRNKKAAFLGYFLKVFDYPKTTPGSNYKIPKPFGYYTVLNGDLNAI